MAIRDIVIEGDEILRKKSKPVEVFDEKLWTLLDDMADTMYQNSGAGLAAVQVGILRRVAVVDTGGGLIELVNPVIVGCEGEQVDTEGCLSCPGEALLVKRPLHVKVKAFDRFGNPFEIEGSELTARAFCHEIDHLDGILFKDKGVIKNQ